MDLNKLKNSRSSQAGWVTRTLNKFEENNNSPAALDLLSDRIQGQLERFRKAHDAYVSAEENEEDIENAETQYEEYFNMATKCLCDIDERLKELQREEASKSTEVKQPIETQELPSTSNDESASSVPPVSSDSSSSASQSTLEQPEPVPSTSDGPSSDPSNGTVPVSVSQFSWIPCPRTHT